MSLAWDPSPSPVNGYVVYFGTSPGVYSGSIDAGAQTNALVLGLTNGVKYYFAVKGYEGFAFSAASNEVSGFPTNTAPPTIVNPGPVTRTAGPVTIAIAASDADGDQLAYSATGLPAGVAINPLTGVIGGLAAAGTYDITTTVFDGVLQASTTFTLTVTPATAISGPISQWSFNEGRGLTAGDAAGGRTATLTNGALWTSGHHGFAVGFDGANDYLALPTFDMAGPGLTISAWIRSTSLTSEPTFVSKASGTEEDAHYWTLGVANTGTPRLRFRLKTGTTTTTLIASSASLPTGVWYHVVATYDGAVMRLYLNGLLVAGTTKTGTIAQNSSDARRDGPKPRWRARHAFSRCHRRRPPLQPGTDRIGGERSPRRGRSPGEPAGRRWSAWQCNGRSRAHHEGLRR